MPSKILISGVVTRINNPQTDVLALPQEHLHLLHVRKERHGAQGNGRSCQGVLSHSSSVRLFLTSW